MRRGAEALDSIGPPSKHEVGVCSTCCTANTRPSPLPMRTTCGGSFARGQSQHSERAMLDVNNPEIKVEELMQRIREKVRARRPAASGVPAPTVLSGFDVLDGVLERAEQVAPVGVAVPGMTRQHGLKRALAGGVAKAFLRVAQL